MDYKHPSEIMDEIARLTPTFTGVSYARIDELGSIQWPCNEAHPEGTPTMHIGAFVRGKGKFLVTEYVPTRGEGQCALSADHDDRADPQPIQRRRPDPSYENNRWHDEDRVEIHPHDARNAASRKGIGSVSQAAPATRSCAPR